MMGCTFVISALIKKSFNCGIADNPSSNKAELMAVILSLMTCPKAANVEIYSDSQWVVNTFDELNFLTIKDIERSKVNYKVLWSCLFKIISIYSLKVKITKVKAHSDCDHNKEADKLAKSGAEKNVLIIEDKLLLHNGTVCWRDMSIERNPILMIKRIKNAQFIEKFLMLHRNEVYKQSDLLRIKICCNELPTCVNLKKRKPDLYDEDCRCNFCKIEE
ncbi:ribonuclease H-like domain-containing protein [Rhizophagus irregularis DAOM 181602=DAOM 197198]|nr:ribonuclease H-like domain-containing protein [Rhizophagus irregularis DAOM 181602=DAOM 197198]